MARRPTKPVVATGARTIRCAVYTRKSTEEGLEQAFNSLDAQREACKAYILSQRHEGWTPVTGSYDDGGFSGGNMERPALKRLMADIKDGKVDVIVVYKVDRLTRALSDFAKIVEVLDARGASFVSVTQAFNTTTSMGRLTLNVLLSFAQFEREVTGERIRDKIAASKKKGMWMGGPVPLGYRVEERKLLIDDADAAQVRHIFTRYAALGSGQLLLDELDRDGYRTRIRPRADGGPPKGGVPFSRGMLFAMLGNRIYLGDIVHQGISYPGEHAPIIDTELWDRAQAVIDEQRVKRSSDQNRPTRSLLAGLLIDGHGRRMSPTHAVKGERRYRYYITPAEQLTDAETPAWRMPAHDLEAAVTTRLQQFLKNRAEVTNVVRASGGSAQAAQIAIARAQAAAADLGKPELRHALVRTLVRQIRLTEDAVTVDMDRAELITTLDATAPVDDVHAPMLTLTMPATRIRRGKDVRLVLADGDGRSASIRDDKLVALLIEARTVQDLMLARPDCSIKQLAAESGRCRTRFAQLIKVSMLAPDIAAHVLDGTQPASLTPRMLLTMDLPVCWKAQRAAFGVD